MSLLRTACAGVQTPTACASINSLCASDSAVEQCTSSPPLAGLPTAASLYEGARKMCTSMPGMSACSQCKAASSSTQAAEAASCPNPLSALSALCLDMSMDGCQGWTALCATDAGAAFSSLCSSGGVSPMNMSLTNTPSPSPAPAPAPAPGGTPPSPSLGGCYDNPGAAECASFQQSDSVSNADAATLCRSMPFMTGCSLQHQCEQGTASGPYCQPFSILADLCIDMPSMNGCQRYNALCGPGSVVAQCTAVTPVPHMVMTYDAIDAVLAMCASMSMPGCSQCTSKSNCPDPIATLSSVCLGMPGMSQCAPFVAMCEANAGGRTFAQLCGGGGDSGPPAMRMWLHASMSDMILFLEWVPTTNGAYIGSCIAIIALGVLIQLLKAWRVRREALWAAAMHVPCCGPGGPKMVDEEPWFGTTVASRLGFHDGALKRNAVRCLFTGFVVFLDFIMMLIVMTFNVGIIISASLGYGLGALFFGHWGERPGAYDTQSPNHAAGTAVDEMEVHFVEAAPCCSERV